MANCRLCHEIFYRTNRSEQRICNECKNFGRKYTIKKYSHKTHYQRLKMLSYLIRKGIVKWSILLFLMPFVYADGLGDCPLGDYPFGDGCPVVPPPTEEPSAGGGILRDDAQPALAEAIRKNQTPTCTEGNQYFEGACYPCRSDGILFRRIDQTIVCVYCNEGFEYDGNGGCQQIGFQPTANYTGFNLTGLAAKISPKNPYVGVALILVPVTSGLYWIYTRFVYARRYEKQKKKEEELNIQESKEEKKEEALD